MAQPFRYPSHGKRAGLQPELAENPQSKRRRVENPFPAEEAEEWDDSFEFTQHDLETLDVIASQAIGEPSTSTGHGAKHRDVERTVLDSTTSYIAAPEREHVQPSLFQVPVPGAVVRLKNRSSTSSSSDSSVYPHSSASFRKTPSSDISSAAGSLTSSKSSVSFGHASDHEQTTGDVTVTTVSLTAPGKATQGHPATVAALQEQLRKRNEEVQKTRSELYAKDGEVKFLKDSLHKQEGELEKLRGEHADRKEAEEQQQKETEKALAQEVERLKTQIQFKEQDHNQLQQRCRQLELKLQQPSPSASEVTMSQPQGSPDKSPKVRKVVVQGSRTPEKQTFPSHHSFMSTVDVPSSPRPQASRTQNQETMTTEMLHEPQVSQGVDKSSRSQQSRLRLKTSCPGGGIPGPRLASHLLNCGLATSGEVEDAGIVGLLQMLPSRLDLAELQYERDVATTRLSPVKKSSKRRSSRSRTLTQQQQQQQPDAPTRQPVVEREHFLLAVQGLRQLIDPATSSPALTVPLSSSASTSAGKARSSPVSTSQLQEPSGALLLLPMLDDYLTHYLDILSGGGGRSSTAGGAATSPSLSSSSAKSSSLEGESSLESVGSSLCALLEQGAEYANNVESLTLTALRVLLTLVHVCEEVRRVFVNRWSAATSVRTSVTDDGGDNGSSAVETDVEREKTTESGVEGDDERSVTTTSSKNASLSPTEFNGSPAAMIQRLSLLSKVVQLASPGHQNSGFNTSVVEAALDILIALAKGLSGPDLDRLHVIVVRGVLTEVLQLEQQSCITARALHLFCCLVRSRAILPLLCTRSDNCTLLNIHLVSSRLLATCHQRQELSPAVLHIISKVVDAISAVVSYHRNGVDILTDNNCNCSAQIVSRMVYTMLSLLRDFQVSKSEYIFSLLRKGVLLLHDISLQDPNFQQRIYPLHYSPLLAGLTRIYKDKHEELPQVEMSALDDLCEELDESDAGSQDSDREEPMP